ncbi:MAG: hypothetical protein ACRC35_00760 [Angustibacter sp.]
MDSGRYQVGGTSPPRESSSQPADGPLAESAAWNIVATLMSGLLGFGLPAWLVGRVLGWEWLVGVGLLVGMAAALTVVWFRYGTDRQ